MKANNSSKNEDRIDNSQQTDIAAGNSDQEQRNSNSQTNTNPITLPKGGGAISGMGEKFQANPVTGTGSFSVPVAVSPGRNGFSPQLALSYDSGQGNSAFGLGWTIGVPSISRKTQKGLPTYQDETDEDIFLLSGFEDLVPALEESTNGWEKVVRESNGYEIKSYRPRTEGAFAKIEKHLNLADQRSFWKVTTKDNITTIYGDSGNCRIAHPQDQTKIFQWLISYAYDEKGNIIQYQYIEENTNNVPEVLSEKNRLDTPDAFSFRYLKSVNYTPDTPFDPEDTNWFSNVNWHFTLVADYGDHDPASPAITPSQNWPVRQDPFSTYRAGFEQRQYRLCRRMLMFHRFDELGTTPYLVKSTDITYDENPVATRILEVKHTCYESGKAPLTYPPVTFTYSEAEISEQVLTYAESDLENLPGGVTGQKHQWTDLYGEGLPGVLIEDQNAWYYKRNLGDENYHRHYPASADPAPEAKLGHLTKLLQKPQPGFLDRAQIYDVDGNGTQDLVLTSGLLKGYFPQDRKGNWEGFREFVSVPQINWQDPNLRVIDLDGDGFPDLVLTEENCFTWYRSLAEEGYEKARRTSKPFDEEQGPAIVFSEPLQTIFLADMSGDGLTDIVRIRNGSVCYWPNLGYGRFGSKVSLTNAPLFDNQELFDPQRIRLADVDGSGTTDIIYLHRNGVAYYPNESGNRLSDQLFISQYLPIDDLTRINVIDLLGNGTNCLVWSTPVPGNQPPTLKYIDLMGGIKPYLLTEVNNNMGSRTRMKYAPSTKFYLQDERNGTPWLTKLPFPVQVIERVEVYDEIQGNRFVSTYAYRHGYYDGEEREFRGFGMVEQRDTESFADFSEEGLFDPGTNTPEETLHVPPVLSRSWFHLGYDDSVFYSGFADENYHVLDAYRQEYWNGDAQALPPKSKLSDQLAAISDSRRQREAIRTLRGSLLRQEVYSLDGSAVQDNPYVVTENAYELRTVQPRQLPTEGTGTIVWRFSYRPKALATSMKGTLMTHG